MIRSFPTLPKRMEVNGQLVTMHETALNEYLKTHPDRRTNIENKYQKQEVIPVFHSSLNLAINYGFPYTSMNYMNAFK